MNHFTESTIEQAALDWLKDLGYTVLQGGCGCGMDRRGRVIIPATGERP